MIKNTEKTIVSLIVTHQARMRCLTRKQLDPIMNDSIEYEDDEDELTALLDENRDSDTSFGTDDTYHSMRSENTEYGYFEDENMENNPFEKENDDSYSQPIFVGKNKSLSPVKKGGNKSKMPRFKNGSVLEVVITKENIYLRLVVEGEIDEEKSSYVYYVRPGNEENDVGAIRGRYKVTPFMPMTLPNKLYPQVNEKEAYVFYVARHGQATHNLANTRLKKAMKLLKGEKDTSLTDTGYEQAVKTGTKLRDFIKTSQYGIPTHFFISDLKRTRQTLEGILDGLNQESVRNIPLEDPIKDVEEIVVLPCSHELNYKSSGNCDGNQKITPPENITTCSTKDPSCLTTKDYPVNWDYYYDFYGNATRSSLCKSCGHQRCRDTDMINEAIKIIKKQIKQARHVHFLDSSKQKGGKKITKGRGLTIRLKKMKKGGQSLEKSKIRSLKIRKKKSGIVTKKRYKKYKKYKKTRKHYK